MRHVLRAQTVGHRAVLVGHSGGGLFLPAIAESFGGGIAALVFVDSFVPPPVGEVPLVPPRFREELRALAVGDELPPWSSWFGPQAMQELVPDDDVRDALEAEMPRLPVSFVNMSIPVPAGWDRLRCAYLLLTRESYGESACHARSRGWPTVELGGGHLATVNEPPAIAGAILGLTGFD
jgi:pimeloyl-ACP methyl ester carboxylesterase